MYRIDDSRFPEVVTKVRLISTPDCNSCPNVRSFLERNGIPYEEAYVSEASAEELAQMEELSIMTAPVLFVNDLLVAAGGVQYPVLNLIKTRQAANVAA